MITLSVLGPVVCTTQDGELDLGGWRQRAVLARLLVARGHVVSVDRLIDDIWGDDRPAQAVVSLQAYVSRLRRALEPSRAVRSLATTIVTSPPGYRVTLTEHQVDAWQFEELMESVSELGPDSSDRVRGTLKNALALWRGEPYADFADEPWVAIEVNRLSELRLTALESCAVAELRLSRSAEAINTLEAVVDLAPLRDTAWHLLALANYRAGRQADALAVIGRARETLVRESGLDLLPALRDLESALLSQTLTLDEHSPFAPEPAAARALTPDRPPVNDESNPFLGRSAELFRLVSAAARVRAGRSRVCVIEGHSGTGKTRLLTEFADRLAAEGWLIGIGRCVTEAGAPPGFPWVAITEEVSEITRTTLPSPMGQPSSVASTADPYLERFRLHRRISNFLRSAAHEAPLLLAIDDVQNADGETLALLAHLVRDLANDRVLFLCVQRDDEGQSVRETIADLVGASSQLRIELGGLNLGDVAQLLHSMTPLAISDEHVETIHRRTGGNVLFVRQFGSLLDTAGPADGSTTEAVLLLPAGIRDLVRHRVRRLSTQVQSLLASMAVIGAETDVDLLAAISDDPDDLVVSTVESALHAGLLTEPQPGRIDFAHDVVKECISSDMSDTRRSRIHARIAGAVRDLRPSDTSMIAHHYARAPRPAFARETVDFSRRAALEAERQFAFHTAAVLWRQARDAIDAAPDANLLERLELTIDLVRTTALGGNAAEARELRTVSLAEAADIDDPAITARLIASYDVPSLWLNQEYGFVDAFLVSTIERTIAQLPSSDSEIRCRLLTCLALELEWSGEDRGRDAAASATAMARRLRNPRLLATALNAQFRLSYLPGQLTVRREIANELLPLTQRNGILPLEVLARLMLAECDCAFGTFGSADHHHAEARRLAATYHLPSPAAVSSWYDGLRELVRGDLDAARQAYARAAEISSRTRLWENEQAWVAGSEICMALEEGRIGEIVELCELGARLWPGPGTEAYAMALFASGHENEARALHGVDPRREAAYLLSVTWRAFAGLMLNDPDRVTWSYRELLPYRDEIAAADTAVIAHGPVEAILGDLAIRMGKVAVARDHYRGALAVAERTELARWISIAQGKLATVEAMQADYK